MPQGGEGLEIGAEDEAILFASCPWSRYRFLMRAFIYQQGYLKPLEPLSFFTRFLLKAPDSRQSILSGCSRVREPLM